MPQFDKRNKKLKNRIHKKPQRYNMLKFEDFQDLCFTVNIRYKNEGENPGITSEMA